MSRHKKPARQYSERPQRGFGAKISKGAPGHDELVARIDEMEAQAIRKRQDREREEWWRTHRPPDREPT